MKEPAKIYSCKWHKGWWYLARVVNGIEEIIPGPHFDNEREARNTAEYLSRQQDARLRAAGLSGDRILQNGEYSHG